MMEHSSVQTTDTRSDNAMLKGRMPKVFCVVLMAFFAVAFALYQVFADSSLPLWLSGVLELVLLGIPCFILLPVTHSTLPMAPVSAKRVLLVCGLSVTSYSITAILNSSWTVLWTMVLQEEASEVVQKSVDMVLDAPLWALILIIALTPAIFEELYFRGILMKSYASDPAAAICFSAALFALLHYDIVRLLPTFYLGAFFGWIVMRTRNLAMGSILHFVNNAIAMIVTKFSYTLIYRNGLDLNNLDSFVDRLSGDTAALFGLLAIELLVGVLLILMAVLFFLMLRMFIRDTNEDMEQLHREGVLHHDKPSRVSAILFCVIAFAMLLFIAVTTRLAV